MPTPLTRTSVAIRVGIVRVSGVGMTPFEGDSQRPLVDLAAAAAEKALADAGVDPADVDALHFGNAPA
ncbi:hypothetical protein DJ72_07335, partial [Halorubrum distributum]